MQEELSLQDETSPSAQRVNAALAALSLKQRRHRGKNLALAKKFPNPCVFKQRGYYVLVHAYADKTLMVSVVSVADPTSGAESAMISNTGKTALKNIVRGLAHSHRRQADVVDIDGRLRVVLGKCGCAAQPPVPYTKVHMLIPLVAMDAAAALGTFAVAERARAKAAARSESLLATTKTRVMLELIAANKAAAFAGGPTTAAQPATTSQPAADGPVDETGAPTRATLRLVSPCAPAVGARPSLSEALLPRLLTQQLISWPYSGGCDFENSPR